MQRTFRLLFLSFVHVSIAAESDIFDRIEFAFVIDTRRFGVFENDQNVFAAIRTLAVALCDRKEFADFEKHRLSIICIGDTGFVLKHFNVRAENCAQTVDKQLKSKWQKILNSKDMPNKDAMTYATAFWSETFGNRDNIPEVVIVLTRMLTPEQQKCLKRPSAITANETIPALDLLQYGFDALLAVSGFDENVQCKQKDLSVFYNHYTYRATNSERFRLQGGLRENAQWIANMSAWTLLNTRLICNEAYADSETGCYFNAKNDCVRDLTYTGVMDTRFCPQRQPFRACSGKQVCLDNCQRAFVISDCSVSCGTGVQRLVPRPEVDLGGKLYRYCPKQTEQPCQRSPCTDEGEGKITPEHEKPRLTRKPPRPIDPTDSTDPIDPIDPIDSPEKDGSGDKDKDRPNRKNQPVDHDDQNKVLIEDEPEIFNRNLLSIIILTVASPIIAGSVAVFMMFCVHPRAKKSH